MDARPPTPRMLKEQERLFEKDVANCWVRVNRCLLSLSLSPTGGTVTSLSYMPLTPQSSNIGGSEYDRYDGNDTFSLESVNELLFDFRP